MPGLPHVSNTIARHTGLSAGDRLTVLRAAELPAAPRGMRWRLDRVIETMPERFEYSLVTDTPRSRAPVGLAGRVVNVREGEQPPTAPEGMVWRLRAQLQSMPPQHQYLLVEKDPRVDVGDVRRTLRKDALPKAPDGTIWELSKTLETSPEQYEYKLVIDTNLYLGDTRTVLSEDELPPAPKDMMWQLEAELESYPVQYKYRLVAGHPDGVTARFENAIVDAFADGRVNRSEAIRMIGAASNVEDNALMYAAYLNRRGSHDRDAAGIISEHLAHEGAQAAGSPLVVLMNAYRR